MQESTVISELHPAMQQLLEVAKARGWLSYEELNNTLPDDMVDTEQLDFLLTVIDRMGLELIDELEYKARLHRESIKRGDERGHNPQKGTRRAGGSCRMQTGERALPSAIRRWNCSSRWE